MTHEEARRRLRLGADAEAEAYVAGGSACFAVIERGDSLVLAVRRARPDPVAPPLSLAARVLSRWTFRRRLPWLAGAGALAAASVASALLVWVVAASFSVPATVGESALGALLAPLAALLAAFTDLLRARFLDPASFAALVVVAAVGGAGFAVLYRQATFADRRVGA